MSDRQNYIASFASGQKWLNCLPSLLTKTQYANYLKMYCEAVNKNPDELIQLKIEGLKHTGELNEFIAEDLLQEYLDKCTLSANAKLSLKNAVFSFYKWNRRALEKTTASNVKNEIQSAKSRTPTLNDIQEIEDVLIYQRDKALNRFIASTAFRVGTIQQLTWNDLKATGNSEVPYSLVIEAKRLKGSGIGKYRGLKQVAFVNHWASEKLEAYKAELKQKGYELSDTDPIFIKYRKADKKILPLKSRAIFNIYDTASLKCWGDLEKKKFSGHDYRSFFNSALESTKLNENIISPLMAHKAKGIAQSYSDHNISELMQAYIQALPYLIPRTASQIEAELTETKAETNLIKTENKALQDKLTKVDNFLTTLTQLQNKQLIKSAIEQFKQHGFKETFVFGDTNNLYFTHETDKSLNFSVGRNDLNAMFAKLAELEKQPTTKE